DIDLLVATSGAPALFKNLRSGTFQNVAADVGLRIEGRVLSVAAADVNKDDFPDFFFGRAGSPGVLASSDGRGRFSLRDAPAATKDADAAQFFDYDNDGLLDLFTVSTDGPHLFRQLADGWMDVTSRAWRTPSTDGFTASPRAVAVADFTGDEAADIL